QLALFGASVSSAVECALAVLLQFPAPAVQIAGMHFQGAGDLGRALPTVEAAHRRFLEFFCELSAGLHLQFSPFNDFQGLTGCLKNGVHSKRLCESRTRQAKELLRDSRRAAKIRTVGSTRAARP